MVFGGDIFGSGCYYNRPDPYLNSTIVLRYYQLCKLLSWVWSVLRWLVCVQYVHCGPLVVSLLSTISGNVTSPTTVKALHL